ncbi:MAG: sulfatase activating formylglycine-generating enzyme [Saprospiraceae bacterium]
MPFVELYPNFKYLRQSSSRIKDWYWYWEDLKHQSGQDVCFFCFKKKPYLSLNIYNQTLVNMNKHIPLLLFFCFLSISFSLKNTPEFRKGKDYAVFFYVSSFQSGWKDLPQTRTESREIMTELENNFDFTCEAMPDPSKKEIKDKIAEYNRKLMPNDQVLFFFSMHGHYDKGANKGYLVASDGKAQDEYNESYLSYEQLGTYLSKCKAKHVLVALDACHSGAFGSDNTKSGPSIVAYNSEDCFTRLDQSMLHQSRLYCSSGNKDAKTPAESRFAMQFLQALREGGNNGTVQMRDLAYALGEVTTPKPVTGYFKNHKANGDFVFVKKGYCGSTAPTADLETAAYNSAKNQNTIDAFDYYLALYPSGRYRHNCQYQKAKLEEERSWKIAQRLDTPAAYRGYLDTYSNGKHTKEATLKAIPNSETAKILPLNHLMNDDNRYNMVFVKGGTFEMGCTSEQQDCGSNEKPAHSVTLSDFYIGKYEVTQAEWEKIMGDNPSSFTNCDQCPVEKVSWEDIQEFLKKLNAKYPNKNYRLPTEAEWEYAARGGGKKVLFGNGKNIVDPKEINFDGSDNYKKSYSIAGVYREKTVPVGSLNSPNELKLHDMSGNVWEWCSDWYDSDYYKNSPSQNPQGAKTGSYRVLRGGSWFYSPQYCRVANRYAYTPTYRDYYIGFRLARSL